MSTVSLEKRVEELEMRLAFQEQTLLELNDALTQSRLEHARTCDALSRALDEMRQIRAQILALDPACEPPPHY